MSGKPLGVTGGVSHHPLPSSAGNTPPAAPAEGKTSSSRTVEQLPADAAQTSSSSVQSSGTFGYSVNSTFNIVHKARMAADVKALAEKWAAADSGEPLETKARSGDAGSHMTYEPPDDKAQRTGPSTAAARAKPLDASEYWAHYDPDGTIAGKEFFKSMSGKDAVARPNQAIFDTVDSVISGKSNDDVVSLGKELLAAARETRKSIADDLVRAVACRIGKHYKYTGADMASWKNEVADLAAQLGDSRGSYRSMTPIAMGLRIAIDPTTPNRVGNFSPEERAAALKLGQDNR